MGSGGTGLASVQSSKHRHSKVLWQRRVANAVDSKVLALAGGVLLSTRKADQCSLRLLHVRDGSQQWQASFVASDTLSVARTGQTVVCVAPEALTLLHVGQRAVVHKVGVSQGRSFQKAICAKKGYIHAVSSDAKTHFISAIDARTGRLLWENELPESVSGKILLFTAGDHLVCVNQGPHQELGVDAYHRHSGQRTWSRRNLQGSVLDTWSTCNLVDLVLSRGGICGLNGADGTDRIQRLEALSYADARIAGQSFLAVTETSDVRELLSLDTLSGELRGKLPTDITRVIGAHASEVLTEHPDGYPEMFSLPKLEPVELAEAKAIGKTHDVVWARDVAYLVAKDRHTITALDLRHA